MLYTLEGVFIDFETTGLKPYADFPTQLAMQHFKIEIPEDNSAARVSILGEFNKTIKPYWWSDSHKKALEIQGKTEEAIDEAGTFPCDIYPEVIEFLKAAGCIDDNKIVGARVWAHNSEFDHGFFKRLYDISRHKDAPAPHPRNNFRCTKKFFATLGSLGVVPLSVPDNLEAICQHYGIPMSCRSDNNFHDPLEDVNTAILALSRMLVDLRNFHRGLNRE